MDNGEIYKTGVQPGVQAGVQAGVQPGVQNTAPTPTPPGTQINDITSLKRGDQIAMKRVLYEHHAIITKVNREANTVEVIHASGSSPGVSSGSFGSLLGYVRNILQGKEAGTIKREVIPFNSSTDTWRIVNYAHCYDAEYVIQSAEWLFDHASSFQYNLLTNNCEHVATYCKTGQPISAQSNFFMQCLEVFISIAILIVVVIVFLALANYAVPKFALESQPQNLPFQNFQPGYGCQSPGW